MSSTITTVSKREDHVYADDDGDDVPLPGFRFHPTDEELVGFYLRRKVEKKPIRIELIKHADIYKYDPWDLPKSSNNGDKEWYFFCKRGRKYKNSIRPNRVTGSGFWKATGIDKPVYSSNGEARSSHIIGLKKSLVYYRGSAGKGAKTEWMMHEFRLPTSANSHDKKISTNKPAIEQEAEVWTLCRILKREVSYNKRYAPDWRKFAAKKRLTACSINMNNPILDAAGSSETCSMESINCDRQSSYISFNNSAPSMMMTINRRDDQHQNCETKPYYGNVPVTANHQQSLSEVAQSTALFSSSACNDVNELLRHADWEELRNILDCAAAANPTNYYYPFCL